MATTTAFIFVGTAHRNDSGLIPRFLIQFTENSRPALILKNLLNQEEDKVMIPTLESTLDDVMLMIAVHVLDELKLPKSIVDDSRTSMYDLFNKDERISYYQMAREIVAKAGIKVVFNILSESHLLTLADKVTDLPNDVELTLPNYKKEYSSWVGRVSEYRY
jgi:hypothetical protein